MKGRRVMGHAACMQEGLPLVTGCWGRCGWMLVEEFETEGGAEQQHHAHQIDSCWEEAISGCHCYYYCHCRGHEL